jgi:hypothetical protein
MSTERLGLVDELRARTAAVVAANPHLAAKITGRAEAVVAPLPAIRVQPLFARGRYIPRSLSDLIDAVCLLTDIHRDGLTGHGRTRRLVDARSCVAVLALEFAPRHSEQAIDDGLLRGSGCCAWYRARHEDRRKLYPQYAALFDRCHAAIVRAQS